MTTLNREGLDNTIHGDLAVRNQNWDTVENILNKFSVAQPTNLVATAMNEEVVLAWTNPTNIIVKDTSNNDVLFAEFDSVELKRNGSIVYTGTLESYTDSGLTNNQEYSYEIISVSKSGTKSLPASVNATPSPPTMDLNYNVTNFNLSSGNTEIVGSWANPVELDFAGVMVRASNISAPAMITDGDLIYEGNLETFTETGLTNDVERFYTIWAYNDANQYSETSISSSATPIEFSFGPGSTTLEAGDMTTGWFGEVTTTEFGVDHREIDTLLGLSAGTPQNDTEPFLKFIHDGKIKFIPKKSTRNDLSWDDTNIALGGSAGGAPAEKIITVGDFQYKARFMRGAGRVIEQANGELYTDSYGDDDRASIYEGVNGNWNAESPNEWNTLILPIHTDSDGGGANKNNFSHPAYAPDHVPDWASYTDTDLNITGDGRIVWCAETRDDNTATRVLRANSGSSYFNSSASSSAHASIGARLVLELL